MDKKKKRIKVSSAKAKGRACQQYVMRKISDLLQIPCGKDEQIASREMGQTGTDVRLVGRAKELFPWSVECKWQESWSIPSWIEQAKENQLPGTDWLLVCRRSRSEPVVVLDAEVFFGMLRVMYSEKIVKSWNREDDLLGQREEVIKRFNIPSSAIGEIKK